MGVSITCSHTYSVKRSVEIGGLALCKDFFMGDCVGLRGRKPKALRAPITDWHAPTELG
jgi:hypothetical protein